MIQQKNVSFVQYSQSSYLLKSHTRSDSSMVNLFQIEKFTSVQHKNSLMMAAFTMSRLNSQDTPICHRL